ncbi:hypothetical protein SH1V18_34680 [Vallitalea longa]|uniref:Uncharacterized protein n=1 Tax=Vallitalea longa TaxID=2936439 RepID=A0A9W5YGZ1_9FIRM|nr:DEAD/DEAH box helicase [Vallitalea longa]GKX30988.1 hypothetical protein SH1V18_34680 [Vallitalea longa]
MCTINIQIEENQKRFVLQGEIKNLINSRRAKRYIKDYLVSDISYSDKIYIYYEDGDKEKVLTKIRKMLKKFNLLEQTTDLVKDVLSDYYQEEINFDNFKKKAYSIRNNKCNKIDFKQFTDSLYKNLSNRRLYELQLLSSYHLAFSQNACNFSVPGAGKTSIVYGSYAFLSNLEHDNPKYVNKLLVIGPLSSFGPWENEYYECFGKKPTSKRLSGGVSKSKKIDYLRSYNTSEITLISYQGIINILDDLIIFLKKNKVMVILDEAHKIKNTDGGIIADSVLNLAKYCKSRVILTGTPSPNGYEDLFNLYKFIWPNKDIIKYHLYQLKSMSDNLNDTRISNLIDNISPFFIRIKKSDLKIPEPINNPPLIVDMGPVQRKIYNFIEKEYMKHFIKENKINRDFKSYISKSRLIRLMQVATNPALLKRPVDEYYLNQGLSSSTFIDDSEIIKEILSYEKFETPSKFIEAGKLVKQIINRNEKVIIWTTFVQNILELSDYLLTIGIKSKLLYGETPVDMNDLDDKIDTRESIIQEFHKKTCEFKVIIANPFSVAESISLHKACHNAIYLERTFNASHFIQSKDRIHRYGLKKDDVINYYYLISNNSIDETIHERLNFKEERMNKIIESEPIPLFNNIDEEFADVDIRTLIKDYVNRHK